MHESANKDANKGANQHAAPTRWQTVMFDPLAYIHPERLHLQSAFETPAQRAALNRLLIAHYRLAMPEGATASAPVRAGAAEICLLKHWPALPRIVFLLGCRRLHLALLRRGALLKLPASAQAFLKLPLPLSAAVPLPGKGIPGRALLQAHGVQQLRLALGNLPPLLAQRLPLLFAPAFDEQEIEAAPAAEDMRDPAHALTLMMAIQHVKRYPAGLE